MPSADAMKRTETKFACIIPIFNVKNVPASIDHYVKVLGFKKDWDWGDSPGFGAVSRDHCHIMLCQGDQGQAGTWIWISVGDVEKLDEEYRRVVLRIERSQQTTLGVRNESGRL